MITYGIEKLDLALPALQELLLAQWPETGDQNLTCAPNWGFYRALEKSGNVVLLMAREGSRAVGYAVALVYPNPNATQSMVGSVPTWFMEMRPGRAIFVRSLLKAAITWLSAKTAKKIIVETEYGHSAGRLLEAMGFTPEKIGYKLVLET